MAAKPIILVADEERQHVDLLEKLFSDSIQIIWAPTARQALDSLQQEGLCLMICDVNLNDGADGFVLLEAVKQRRAGIPVVITSSSPSIEICKQAIRRGAWDFLVKPVEPERLRSLVEQAVPAAKQTRAVDDFVFKGVYSRSPLMQSVYRILRRVAPTDLSVLIEGESGTGKELTARAVHDNSRRQKGPFCPINCAGLAETLLESELFGHVKGAFTGATSDRKGLFQLADGGTLFLDEIGDMPLPMQAKLLRVLEDGIVRPVGATRSVVVDVRVISATNCNLAALVEEKKFRQDLYFRIKEAAVTLPPLRKRPQDIPELFGYFLKEACEETGRDIHLITEPAMRTLMSYSWPGNIRQLRNVIRTMVVMCDKDILDLRDLPPEISCLKQLGAPDQSSRPPILTSASVDSAPSGFDVPAGEPIDLNAFTAQPPETESDSLLNKMAGKSLEEVEREHIRRTLEMTGHNRAEAARILKIGERTLYRKIKEYSL
jgi:two-component system response regulator HydG